MDTDEFPTRSPKTPYLGTYVTTCRVVVVGVVPHHREGAPDPVVEVPTSCCATKAPVSPRKDSVTSFALWDPGTKCQTLGRADVLKELASMDEVEAMHMWRSGPGKCSG